MVGKLLVCSGVVLSWLWTVVAWPAKDKKHAHAGVQRARSYMFFYVQESEFFLIDQPLIGLMAYHRL